MKEGWEKGVGKGASFPAVELRGPIRLGREEKEGYGKELNTRRKEERMRGIEGGKTGKRT